LAAGAAAIYQVGHVFRAGEFGRLHNPEFTLVEWYRRGDTIDDQMAVTEQLVCEVFRSAIEFFAALSPPRIPDALGLPQIPFLRTSYGAAFLRHAGIDVFEAATSALRATVRERGVPCPQGLADDDRDGWLNLLLAELVEPHLGRDRPEFLYDYPASQSALSRIRPEDPRVCERFELYLRGIELCNGYHELTDAAELRKRIRGESRRRAAQGLSELSEPYRLLSAMEAGLPECTGVALGFDRLVMLAAGKSDLALVLPFAGDRA
jgi:elongation factor P--(R)-beta-lysine ligase